MQKQEKHKKRFRNTTTQSTQETKTKKSGLVFNSTDSNNVIIELKFCDFAISIDDCGCNILFNGVLGLNPSLINT